MKQTVLATIGTFAALASTHAFAQLSAESVAGTERYCSYNVSPLGGDTRSIKIGIGERCPAHYPTSGMNLSPPPTARLESSSIKDGQRVCVYGQRNRTWSFEIGVAHHCAPTAGTFAEQKKASSTR
jgi:hypothetical protein